MWCVLIVCCTLLIFTLLTRNRLCEVRLKDGYREVTATLTSSPTFALRDSGGGFPLVGDG
ncbi:Hok/Gef family protein [Escherichia coli]|nr:Hok/Gef family protein [Escherichia coli]MCA7683520.1 Hok/Gef family protein [Escherichia coli]MCA7707262.1 Hok/Gef family protein [Escherichia coli]UCT21051.1 Hok/Gef family protein [Escherichia coli]